ncbi:restriction endonuclease subunit S [Arthrobacter sp. D2-10]
MKYVDFDFVTGAEGVKVLDAKDFLVPKFLYYQLLLRRPASLGYARHYRALMEVTIVYPDLAEQERIVAKLDEFFTYLGAIRTNVEKNVELARTLFEAVLASTFPPNVPHLKALSTCAESITDGDHSPPPKATTGVPFITISNIDKDAGTIDLDKGFRVPRAYFDSLRENRRPKKNDLLYTVTGSFGIPVLVESDMEFCFQRHIGLIRPNESVLPRWLYYALLSPGVREQARRSATGTAQKTVSLTALRSFQLPAVELEVQKDVVSYLDSVQGYARDLQLHYQGRLKSLDDLQTSVLEQAFTGRN